MRFKQYIIIALIAVIASVGVNAIQNAARNAFTPPSNTRYGIVGSSGVVGSGGSAIAANAAIFCEVRAILATADFNGWYLVNGRLKSTLSAPAQTRATACAGIGAAANIPDATGKGLFQGALGTALGSSSITLSQAQLPNVTLGGSGNPTAGVWGGGNISPNNNSSGNSGIPFWVNATSQTSGFGGIVITTNSINGGVTQQAIPNTPASIGVNYFIYLGL